MVLQQTATKFPSAVKTTQRRLISLSAFSIIAIGILLGIICLINCSNELESYSLKALQILLFFALGNIHIIQRKKLGKHVPALKNKNQVFPIAIAFCILLSIIYIFFKREIWIMALSSSAAFLLPFFLKTSWVSFINIPAKEYSAWVSKALENKVSVFLDSINIKLKLARLQSDKEDELYSVFAPYYVKLGDFFNRFLQEKNRNPEKAIEDANSDKDKYAWEFFITDKYGLKSRRLDPDLTVLENKIKRNSVVYIRREKQESKLLTYPVKNLLNETVKQ